MSEEKQNELEDSQEPQNLAEPKVDSNTGLQIQAIEAVEILPPILQEKPVTLNHVRSEALAEQVRDLARMGLSKGNVAIGAKISLYLLEKYYLQDFLEGQSMMQKRIAALAMQAAEEGSVPMIMYLAKTKLGWVEVQQIEHSGEVRSVVSATPLTKEEFARKYLQDDEKD
jgi:hypothetical protein